MYIKFYIQGYPLCVINNSNKLNNLNVGRFGDEDIKYIGCNIIHLLQHIIWLYYSYITINRIMFTMWYLGYKFKYKYYQFYNINTVQFSHSVVSDSLQPHGLQHARPPCSSPTPIVYSNSSPLNPWWHPTISSSVVPFSSYL